jgi:hypothetical protein
LSTRADDVADEYKDAFTRELSNDHALASDVGMTVHTYAAASDPYIRSAVDVSGLSPDQQDWLLLLSDADLQKLASGGPKACELAVTGKRCGVVGLPVPARAKEPALAGKGGLIRDLLLDRIRASRANAYSR